jgi:aminopeptidase-like protein
LFPLNRSITGNGVRQTLDRISEEVPLLLTSVKSGTNVFDWTVPDEWNVISAKIYSPNGDLIVDFDKNNLFLMGYSDSINTKLTLEELKAHIITDKMKPDWIPYSTSYYNSGWKFCLPYNFVKKMKEGEYKVIIESIKKPGELIYAEAFIDNNAKKEVLISSYICHPSMANDSLSGVVLAVEIYKKLTKNKNSKYNYRFLFTPETIGTICFLKNNKEIVKDNIEYGLVATCVGDSGGFTYKKTRNNKSNINRVVEYVFQENKIDGKIIEFTPLGSDERQYCSPGFNLDMGVLTRSMYGCFPEYHTSADNLDFVSEKNLQESLYLYLSIINAYESNCVFSRVNPYCEPQLSKHNLYRKIGGAGQDVLNKILQQRMWILNYSDGNNDLLSVAKKSGFNLLELKKASLDLVEVGLIYGEEI